MQRQTQETKTEQRESTSAAQEQTREGREEESRTISAEAEMQGNHETRNNTGHSRRRGSKGHSTIQLAYRQRETTQEHTPPTHRPEEQGCWPAEGSEYRTGGQ